MIKRLFSSPIICATIVCISVSCSSRQPCHNYCEKHVPNGLYIGDTESILPSLCPANGLKKFLAHMTGPRVEVNLQLDSATRTFSLCAYDKKDRYIDFFGQGHWKADKETIILSCDSALHNMLVSNDCFGRVFVMKRKGKNLEFAGGVLSPKADLPKK